MTTSSLANRRRKKKLRQRDKNRRYFKLGPYSPRRHISLRELWEAQYEEESLPLREKATAHNMTPDEYLARIAEIQVKEELEILNAAEKAFEMGKVVGGGFVKGMVDAVNRRSGGKSDLEAFEQLKKLFGA